MTRAMPKSSGVGDWSCEIADGSASKLIVAKGKKVTEFKSTGGAAADAVAAMLGPTGNLRAPTMRIGKTLVVGFNEAVYQKLFG